MYRVSMRDFAIRDCLFFQNDHCFEHFLKIFVKLGDVLGEIIFDLSEPDNGVGPLSQRLYIALGFRDVHSTNHT